MNLAELLTGGNVAAASVIWPIMLGVFIAVVISYINKKTIGKLVNKLLALPADSEDNAVTLSEIGFDKKTSLKYALRPDSTLSNVIRSTSDGKYYIPEDQAYRAETVFTQDRLSLMTVIFAGILIIVAGTALLNVLPFVIETLGGIF